MKKEITIKPIYAILIVLAIMFICYHLFGQYQKSNQAVVQRDSVTVQLKALAKDYSVLKRMYNSKKEQMLLVISQRDKSRNDVQKAHQETAKAKSELKNLKNKNYVVQEIDSAFTKRYPSYQNKDSLMNLPVPTGSDIVNDLQKGDKALETVAVQDLELQRSEEYMIDQGNLVGQLLSADSISVAQKKNLETSLHKADSARLATSEQLTKTENKLGRVKKQRNVSFGLNLLQFLLFMAK